MNKVHKIVCVLASAFIIGILFETLPLFLNGDNKIVECGPVKEKEQYIHSSTGSTNPCLEKPVIYLYPEEDNTNVAVKIDLEGDFSCTYPSYGNGWRVNADKDGTLHTNGKEYNYLYWEGVLPDFSISNIGYCIEGSDTARFFEYILPKLGLSRRESNEFIVYWLPQMEQNEYNVISFDITDYERSARMTVTPTPDNMIRVFMTWYGSDKRVQMDNPLIATPSRTGFTVVEWGGCEIEKD